MLEYWNAGIEEREEKTGPRNVPFGNSADRDMYGIRVHFDP